jgi:hypothetical protein
MRTTRRGFLGVLAAAAGAVALRPLRPLLPAQPVPELRPTELSDSDAAMLEARAWTREEVAAWYRLPPHHFNCRCVTTWPADRARTRGLVLRAG